MIWGTEKKIMEIKSLNCRRKKIMEIKSLSCRRKKTWKLNRLTVDGKNHDG